MSQSASAQPADDTRFLFAQLEFSHAIGLPVGTYAVDPGPSETELPSDTLVSEVTAAPARRSLWQRESPRSALQSAPAATAPLPVPLAIVTLVLTSRPLDRAAAATALQHWQADPAACDAVIDYALSTVNIAVRAFRAAACDPYVTEVTRADPRALRVGVGISGHIGTARWEEALEVTPPRAGGAATPTVEELRVLARVAGTLRNQVRTFEAEDVALRALLDLDRGRPMAAAAQAQASVIVLKRELEADGIDTAGVTSTPDLPDDDAVRATATHVLDVCAAYCGSALRDAALASESP